MLVNCAKNTKHSTKMRHVDTRKACFFRAHPYENLSRRMDFSVS